MRAFCAILVSSLVAVTWAALDFDENCLRCICEVESDCRALPCQGSAGPCGYYQITSPYYEDCQRPGTGLLQCSNDKSCAEKCMRNYLKRWGRFCTGSDTIDCQQAARIHNGGINGCKQGSTIGYWNKVEKCLRERNVGK